MLLERSVDGLLLVNTPTPSRVHVPIVSISGHQEVAGVTNIQLNHKLAARLALKHLADLGHRRVAFMKGQEQTVDTDYRWKEIMETARACGMELHQELLIKLTENSWSPALGYGPVKALLSRTRDFTALFAFNDIAAFGAIRALHEAGLRVPDDVSVIGFDDVLSAPFGIPSLTTIRQPLREMGKMGAECSDQADQSSQSTLPPAGDRAAGTGRPRVHRQGFAGTPFAGTDTKQACFSYPGETR